MGELLNLIGLGTGMVLYAMLLAMVVRAGQVTRVQSRVDPLLLVTAVLGLVWNLSALTIYALPKIGVGGPFPAFATIGFSALGFLPAVVVHSVVRGERDGIRGTLKRSVAAAAYVASSVAMALHLHAAWRGNQTPSILAMQILTYSFIVIVVPLAAMTRGQPGGRRAVWVVALAAFAVSALHFSQLHRGDGSWLVELLGHHASLPLAFAILYQDYPFALADLFLKRGLTLLVLVSTAFLGVAAFDVHAPAFHLEGIDPRQVAALVGMWVLTALAYPTLRRGTSWFVDTVVLSRPDYPALRTTAARRVQTCDTIPEVLTEVSDLLIPAISARSVTWHELSDAGEDEATPSTVLVGEGVLALTNLLTRRHHIVSPREPAAAVIVPTAEGPRYAVVISGLTGGRRLLSDDFSMLDAIGLLAARRIDALRITGERYEREVREQEIAKLATEAELRALRAQVNPHFLFNTLTTIGYLIQAAPGRALDTLMRLTSLLRGVLRSEGEYTTLARELEIIESYLEIERARFEDRLRVRIDVPLGLRNIRLPPLLLQPIVENAIKHGIAPLRNGGQVTVSARLEPLTNHGPELALVIEDTGSGATAGVLERGRAVGVGLRNVEQRLQCQYGSAASLTIHSQPGRGTTVAIRMPAEFHVVHEPSVGSVV